LTPKGEDELNRRIENFNKERKNKKKNTLIRVLEWIIAPLVIAFLIWFFGLNGNRQAEHSDNIPNIQWLDPLLFGQFINHSANIVKKIIYLHRNEQLTVIF
jgi:hypothetical protein